MGNNHAYPFVWGSYVDLAGGADTVVASGVKYHGMELADNCFVTATVVSGTADGYIYIDKDTANNIITVKSTGSNSVGVDLIFMVGAEPAIEGIYCRGNTGAAQSLP
jgi:hypothetical protein